MEPDGVTNVYIPLISNVFNQNIPNIDPLTATDNLFYYIRDRDALKKAIEQFT